MAHLRTFLAAIFPLSLSGQDTLADLIVTASRIPESPESTKYSAEILTAEDLRENVVKTLPQAFLTTPGVLVQQTTPGHGSPYIRGFNGRQTLLLQDGIRLNNSTWRSGPIQYWNTIDVDAIDRLELVRSQGSVLYGSDAIGGTVNTISRGSNFREETGFFSGGALDYRFDTNSKSHTGRLEQRLGQGEKWGLLLGIGSKDLGDTRDSALGRMRGTGYFQESFDFKFEYALSDSATFTFATNYLNQDDISRWHSTAANDTPWVHGTSFTTTGSDLQRDYDQERSLTYCKLEDVDSPHGWINRWTAILSWQKSQDSEFRARSGRATSNRIIDLDTYGLTLQAESPFFKGDLLWGLDYYQDRVDSLGFTGGVFDPTNRPVADDARYHSLGLFTSYNQELSETFEYSLGARSTYAKAQWGSYIPDGGGDQPGESSWNDLSFSARGLAHLSDQVSLFGGLSQAFRAPNLDDLTGRQFSNNGIDSSGSLNLDPEKFLTNELGLRFQGDRFAGELSGFYTWIDDGIVRVADGLGGEVQINASDGYLFGFEAKGAYHLNEQWELTGALGWNEGRVEKPSTIGGPLSNDFLRRLLPLSGTLALTWRHPNETFSLTGRLTGATHQDRLSSSAMNDTQRVPVNGTPGYLVASLYAGWQATEDLTFTFGLENLTDEDYRIHGSGQNRPGFGVSLGLRYQW